MLSVRKQVKEQSTLFFFSIRIVVYSGKDHDPVECHYGSKKVMLSLIGYQFDRVVTEERRRLLGIVQGKFNIFSSGKSSMDYFFQLMFTNSYIAKYSINRKLWNKPKQC